MRGRRAAARLLSILLPLFLAGCSSMPSWMPLVGRSDPPAEAPHQPGREGESDAAADGSAPLVPLMERTPLERELGD